MHTESATLLAVVAAPVAVLAVVAAVSVWLAVRVARRTLRAAATGLERHEPAIRRDLVSARGSIARANSALDALGARAEVMEADATAWTDALGQQRQAIERLNLGRMGPAVRAVRLAATLARVALLWRSPAR